MIPNVFARVQLFFKFHVVGRASTNNIKSIIHRPAEGPTTAAAAVRFKGSPPNFTITRQAKIPSRCKLKYRYGAG